MVNRNVLFSSKKYLANSLFVPNNLSKGENSNYVHHIQLMCKQIVSRWKWNWWKKTFLLLCLLESGLNPTSLIKNYCKSSMIKKYSPVIMTDPIAEKETLSPCSEVYLDFPKDIQCVKSHWAPWGALSCGAHCPGPAAVSQTQAAPTGRNV